MISGSPNLTFHLKSLHKKQQLLIPGLNPHHNHQIARGSFLLALSRALGWSGDFIEPFAHGE